MAAVLNAFRIKIKLNLYRVRGLLGINSCCSLIISCQVLNQPKCILVLFQKNNYLWLPPGIKFYFSGCFMSPMKNLANIASERHC